MKKLFTYLLISSMVVLSSCTNYDDQFDDLNSQLSTLKSQIDGFTAVSSGVTALQGTVASLQAAVAALPKSTTPATDITGLQSALTALAATVAELKTSLATAATAADVAALTTSLTKVQTDLAELLASNNIYAPTGGTLVVDSASSLAFATALGNKVSIINGSVAVTQIAAMNATELTTLMAKMVSITGNASFTATASGVTVASGFSALTGIASITFDIAAPISLPALVSASNISVTDNSLTTSFSAPKLTTVGTLNAGTLTLARATSVDLSSVTRFNAAQTIVQKNGSVNLSALGNTPETGTVETVFALTLTGAETLTAPLRTAGTITANDLTAVSLPLWKGTSASTFSKATDVVLPKITGAVAINLNTFAPRATKFHYIGAAVAISSTASSYPSFTVGAANTNLTTLIVDGVSTSVLVDAATDLTSLTLTGAAQTVSVTGATSLSDLTLAHTSKLGTVSFGALTVTGNTKLTKITATSLDDISGLTITGNTKLTSVSFPALNSIGTTATGTAVTAATLAINNNDFTATNIQIASETGAAILVAGSITSASGLNGLKAYMDLAVAKAASSQVEFDNVSKITLADGTNQTAAYKPASGKSGFGIDWSGVDNDVDIILKTAATGTTNSAITQKATGSISSTGHAADVTLAVTAGGVTKTATLSAGFTNGISGYNVGQPSTFYPAVAAELNRQFDATAHPFNVVIANDFQRSFTYDLDAFAGGISSPTTLLTGTTRGNLDFNFAGVNATANLTGTISVADEIVEHILTAIKGSAATKTTNVTRTGATLIVTPMITGTAITDVFYTGAAPALNFNAYSAALSLTRALTASHTIVVKSIVESKGWRITVENESLTVKAAELEADGQFLSGGMSSTSRLLASQVGDVASSTSTLVAWANTRSSSNGSFVAAVSASITSWL